jgi:type VI secretion system protein ImpF
LERTATQSVLDRLFDDAPGSGSDPAWGWAESVEALRAAVRRDLEWLLNTRRIVEPAPDIFPEVQQSLYHYGLPDISSLSADSPGTRQRLLRQIEECIKLYEPRLSSVHVSAVEAKGGRRHRVRFVIEGMLRLDPDPEPVIFDSVLETVSGRFRLAEGGNE